MAWPPAWAAATALDAILSARGAETAAPSQSETSGAEREEVRDEAEGIGNDLRKLSVAERYECPVRYGGPADRCVIC
jgi:hypothetical protein